MPLIPVKSIKDYKRINDTLQDGFESDHMGDQDLFGSKQKYFNL